MQEAAQSVSTAMCAVVRLDNETIERLCGSFDGVYPVNYNCPGQLACAGAAEEIDAFCDEIKKLGGRAVKLAVSGAFHTPFMRPATEALEKALAGMTLSSPSVPIYSNTTGEPYPESADDIAKTVAGQASNSVRWESIIRNMYAAGVDTFIEVGAGSTLSGLVKRILPEDVKILKVGDTASLEETIQALGL